MAAKKKPTAAAPDQPLRGPAAWAAAQKRVQEANEAGYAIDRAKRDISEAKSARQRRDNERIQDADLLRGT